MARTLQPILRKRTLWEHQHAKALSVKATRYLLLLAFAFAYLYPLIYMNTVSLMDVKDLTNPSVTWIPSTLYTGNYEQALRVLNLKQTIPTSLLLSAVPALLQTLTTGLTGYGLARYQFPGRRVIIVLIVMTFFIPPQITMIPKYMLFSRLGLLNTPLCILFPAFAGQGINSAIFILVFYQFFDSYPVSLDEAAKLDGASDLMIFWKIAIPVSIPAMIISMLFSFVWYWNETYISSLFLNGSYETLTIALKNFSFSFSRMYPTIPGSIANQLSEGVTMAATNISILPLALFYLLVQKQFVESVDKSGITGI